MQKLILDAVNAYLDDKSNPPSDLSGVKVPDVGSIDKISDAVRRLELLLSLNQAPPSGNSDRETASSILDTNKELLSILNILQGPIQNEIDKLTLEVETERACREELQAEVRATKERWKAEVTRLKESMALIDGSPIRGADFTLSKRLAEAEAEASQLKEIIRTMRIGS